MSEQFWAQVDIKADNVCWPWRGAKTRLGYGRPMIGGRRQMAHRWALAFATGETGDGLFALHSCDNPNCVNPNHLRWGTQAENIQDRVQRGRNGAARGTDNGSCKLTVAQVLAIRSDGRPSRAIAADYGVSQPLIGAIKRRAIWSHLDAMDTDQDGQAFVPAMLAHPQEQAGSLPECHAG